MGHFKVLLFGLFGYERWGGLRPAAMWTANGAKFVPLAYGFWIRAKRGSGSIGATNYVGKFIDLCLFGYMRSRGVHIKTLRNEENGRVFKPLAFGFWIRVPACFWREVPEAEDVS